MPRRVNIVIIAERPEQVTGSDCCGKIEGDFSIQGGQPVFLKSYNFLSAFEQAKAKIEKDFSLKIDSRIVDSRNIFGIWWQAFQLYKNKNVSFGVFIQIIFLLFKVPALVIKGSIVHIPEDFQSIYDLLLKYFPDNPS